MKSRIREEFVRVYRWGVRGFPTVLLQHEERLNVLTHGYRPFEKVQPAIDDWLSGAKERGDREENVT